MINTVRLWTRKPIRLFAESIKQETNPEPVVQKAPRKGLVAEFVQMWEHHANMVVRNIND